MSLASVIRIALVATVAAACAGSRVNGTLGERLTIVNATQETIGYMALDHEIAIRSDPNPEFPAANLGTRIVLPGQEKLVAPADIQGYRPGASVTFWIYRVAAGQARFVRAVTAPGMRDRGPEYRVVIEPFTYEL